MYKHIQAYSYPIAVALIVIAQIHHSRRGILIDFLIICASEIDEESSMIMYPISVNFSIHKASVHSVSL